MIQLMRLLAWLLLLKAASEVRATAYITALDQGFHSLYQRIEKDPQAVNDLLAARPVTAYTQAIDVAQHHYIRSQAASALDVSTDMLSHSRAGMAVINASEQPWLFHKLKLTEVDALNRQGIAAAGFSAVETALNWAQQHQHSELEIESLIVLGGLNITVANYNQAIMHLHTAYQKAPVDGDYFLKGDIAGHLAGIYITRSEFEIAIPYLEESLALNRQRAAPVGMSIDLFELGRANIIIGQAELGKTQLLESKAIAVELNDLQGIAHATNELGYHELAQGNMDAAEQLANEAQQLFLSAENKIMLYDNLLLLTDVYLAKQSYQQAESALNSAHEMLDPELMPYESSRIQYYQAKLMAAQGDHKQAYERLLKVIQDRANIDAKQSAEQLHQLRSRYEIEAQEAQNQLLSKTNQLQEVQIKNRNEQLVYLLVTATLSVLFLLFFMFFTFKYKRQSQRLHDLANFDELTGLRNRSNTLHTIKKIFKDRNQDAPITLVMVDLDHFKDINDLYGHVLGDKVLRTFGEYCRNFLVSNNDIMGRIGGEEFLICLPGRDAEQARTITEQLRLSCLEMPNHITAPGLKVSLSAGIASSQNEPSFKLLLKQADQAMYQAKANGRNQVVIHNNSEQA